MPITTVGKFTVYTAGASYAKEMMLCTHGGIFPDSGMESLGMSVYFYSPHTVEITFDKAWEIMRGNGGGATSISGPQSSIWNYSLEALRGQEGVQTLDAWNDRNTTDGLTKWDWWEVNGNELRTLKDLKAALATIKHTYDVVHFLCCRAWMGKQPPAPFGAVKPPPHK